MTGKPGITIGAALAQKSRQGGHAWVILQYLLGFRALGFEPCLVDCLDPDQATDENGVPCPPEASVQFKEALAILRPFQLDKNYSLLSAGRREAQGLNFAGTQQRVAAGTALLNVNGFITEPEILGKAKCRVFLDIDPGFNQFWHHMGLARVLDGHHHFVTVGGNLGKAGCRIPTCDVRWIPIAPPVALGFWPSAGSFSRPISSICSWRGAFQPISYQGEQLGLRVHEFRQFFPLPRLAGEAFLLALRIDEAETPDLEQLESNGWQWISPEQVAGTPSDYRDFIQSSKAEFMVAKSLYVRTSSGWFSDRTACYLASSKPVLVQDTGLAELYPTGKGLLTFSDLEEACEGVKRIRMDYALHSRSARRLAKEHFAADRVLGRLLDTLDLSRPAAGRE